jgi:ferredoxin-type protein NapG
MSSPDRRHFLLRLWDSVRAGGAVTLGWLGLDRASAEVGPSHVAPTGQQPVRPPGSVDEDDFYARCTRCFLCGEACPRQAIVFPRAIESADPPVLARRPGVAESAIGGAVWFARGTPMILPWRVGCETCGRCGEACPTGAIVPIPKTPVEQRASVRMGTARIDRKICLPWTRTSWCGACFTICPHREHAIRVDHRNRPSIDPEHCTGCGLCVEICPIRHKAIAVEPPFGPDRGTVRSE